jgi:hypothetical protein
LKAARLSKNVVMLLLLAWISTGCYLPLQVDVPESRRLMSTESDEFVPGRTSRADVLIAMGEPDEKSDDESVLTYRSRSIEGIIVVSQCTPPVELDTEMAISYTFDAQGILQETSVAVD